MGDEVGSILALGDLIRNSYSDGVTLIPAMDL